MTTPLFQGFDPYHTNGGAAVSTTLTGHKVLRCAFNLQQFNIDASKLFELQISNVLDANFATAFDHLLIYSGTFVTQAILLASLKASDATHSNLGTVVLSAVTYLNVEKYVWSGVENILANGGDFTIVLQKFTAEEIGTGFTGYMAWEYLPMGKGSSGNKMMHAFDLSGSGEVAISFGYNQSDFSQATTPYVTDCESFVGAPTPIPLTAPSVQMRLTFSANQAWAWEAAIIYNTPLRGQS